MNGRDEIAVSLTRSERALLRRLLKAQGEPVGKPVLLSEVFGYHPDARTHTLETHIWRLRRKIEPEPKKPQKLISVAGGYLLKIEDRSRADPPEL